MSDPTGARGMYEEHARQGHLGFALPLHQRLRYTGLLAHVSTRGRSLLDFGCGHADLFTALLGAGQRPASYHGVDLLPANLERSRSALAGSVGPDLAAAGVRLGGELDASYDVVCCLAVLSVDLGPDTLAQWRHTLADLWARTSGTLVFDLQRVEPGFGDARHRRIDPATLATWARELSVNHLIDNSLADHFSLVVVDRRPTIARDFWNLRR